METVFTSEIPIGDNTALNIRINWNEEDLDGARQAIVIGYNNGGSQYDFLKVCNKVVSNLTYTHKIYFQAGTQAKYIGSHTKFSDEKFIEFNNFPSDIVKEEIEKYPLYSKTLKHFPINALIDKINNYSFTDIINTDIIIICHGDADNKIPDEKTQFIKLSKAIKDCGGRATLNYISISEKYNLDLVRGLLNVIPNNGFFHHINKYTDDQDSIIDSIIDDINMNKYIPLSLKNKDKKWIYNLTAKIFNNPPNTNTVILTATAFIPTSQIDDDLELTIDDDATVDVVVDTKKICRYKLDSVCSYSAENLINYLNYYKDGKIDYIVMNNFKKTLYTIKNLLENLHKTIFRMKKDVSRQSYLKKYFELTKIINEVHTITADTYSLSEENILKLLKLGSQLRHCTLLKNKQYKISDNKIDSKNIPADLKELYLETDNCCLTNLNLIDILNDDDCLCLCARFDHETLKLEETYDLLVSGKASLTYSVLNNEYSFADSKYITGPDNEKINIILPLYLNSDHWENSKKFFDSKFTREEKEIVPFAMLSEYYIKLIDVKKSFSVNKIEDIEKVEKIIKELEFICRDIYLDLGLKESTLEAYDNFNKGPKYRIPKEISDLGIFLVKASIAKHYGHINPITKDELVFLFQNIVCEQSRRQDIMHKKELCNIFNEELLGIPTFASWKKDVDSQVQTLINQKFTNYKYLFQTELGIENIDKGYEDCYDSKFKEILDSIGNDDITSWQFDFNKLKFDPNLTKVISTVQKKFKKSVLPLGQLCNLLVGSEEDEMSLNLYKMGLQGKSGLLSLIVRSVYFKNDDDYMRAIQNDTIGNIFDSDDRNIFFENIIIDFYCNKRDAHKERIFNTYGYDTEARTSLFSNIKRELDYVSVIYGIYKQDIRFFFDKLTSTDCPYAIEKFRVLTSGEYNHIKLYKDNEYNPGWNPSKQNLHKFFQQNKELLTPKEWKELYTGMNHSLDSWFETLEKEKEKNIFSLFDDDDQYYESIV
jgi:hypothetical protein